MTIAAGTPSSVDHEDELDLRNLVPRSVRTFGGSLRRRWRRVDTGALLIILAQLAIVGPVVVAGSFYIDDFRAQTYAAGQPFWPWIVQSNGTHFSPGARTLDWVQTAWFPLDHAWAVLVTLTVRLLLGAAAWALLRRLCGPRPVLLPALALIVTTASLLPATAWYRQSITALPATIAILMATERHVRFVRDPSIRRAVSTVAWIAVGLCFLEKAVVIVPWLAGLSLFLLPLLMGLPRGVVVRRSAVTVVSGGLLLLAFLTFYLRSGSYDTGDGGRLHPGDIVEMLWLNVTRALAPSMTGGPWRWVYPSPYYGVGDPPVWLMVTAGCALAGLLGWSLGRSARRTFAVLGAFAAFYLPCAAVVAVGRLGRIGPVAGIDLRLWSDAVVVLAVLLTVLALGVRPAGTPPPGPSRPRSARRATAFTAVAAVATAAVMLNVSHSTLLFGRAWAENPSGTYVARLTTSLDALGPAPQLVAVVAPDVVPFWVDPNYDTEDLLAPLQRNVAYHWDTRNVRVADDTGQLSGVRWVPVTAVTTPPGWCGFQVVPGSGPYTIRFDAAQPYYRDSQLRVAMLVSAPTSVDVVLHTPTGDVVPQSRTQVRVERGAYRLMWRIRTSARPSSFTLTLDNPAAGLCVTSASIGVPRAVAGGSADAPSDSDSVGTP